MTEKRTGIYGMIRRDAPADAAETYVALSAAFGFTDREIDAMTYVRARAYLNRVHLVHEQRKNTVLGGVGEAIGMAFGGK